MKNLMTDGISAKALRCFQAILAQRFADHPEDPDLAWRLAETARAAGDLNSAAKAYQACLDLAPTRLPAAHRLSILSGLGPTDPIPPGDNRPAPFFLCRSVLAPEPLDALWQSIQARSTDLEPARIAWHGEDQALATNYRQSLRMSGSRDAGPLLLPIVRDLIATHDLIRRFGTRPLSPDRVEVEIASHSDNHFLRMHRDSGGALASRTMTFVFYFFREPKRFQGGDLLLHDTDADSGAPRLLQTTRLTIEHNSLIIFPSDCWHQVLPVTTDSPDPLDGRWTAHGWFHAEE